MFINMNLGNVVEAKPVPPGRYDLVIASAEHTPPKSADKGETIRVSIGIDGHSDAPNLTHFLSLPKPGEDSQKSNFKMLMIKRFLEQFGIPYDDTRGFALEDFAGATAKAQITLSEPDDSGNIYNRLQLERLTEAEGRGLAELAR